MRGALARWQGLYFLATGVWPLIHIRGFEAVTGPKLERWLVKTTGLLIAVIGGALAMAGRRRRVAPEVVWLGAVDVWYSLRGRIAKV